MAKPSIVFAHGLWADGSCFGKLIPTLQAEGHEVMASQHGLDSLATDVTAAKACFARVSGPVVLVGHSYGGTLITHAGTDPRVAALVYIAALAPDADETSQDQQNKFPKTDVFSQIEVTDGRVWLKQSGIPFFCGDLVPGQVAGASRVEQDQAAAPGVGQRAVDFGGRGGVVAGFGQRQPAGRLTGRDVGNRVVEVGYCLVALPEIR